MRGTTLHINTPTQALLEDDKRRPGGVGQDQSKEKKYASKSIYRIPHSQSDAGALDSLG